MFCCHGVDIRSARAPHLKTSVVIDARVRDQICVAGKHTVFGKVLEGMAVVQQIEAVGNPMDGQPSKTVTIVESGQL